MKIRPLLLGSILTSAVLLAGCGSSTAPKPSIVGTYTLTAVNGAALPFIESQGGGVTVQLTSETMTVGNTSAYTRSFTEQTITTSGTTTDQSSATGTYAANGSGGYTFTDSAVGTGSGTLSGNTLTVTLSGVVFVFTRN